MSERQLTDTELAAVHRIELGLEWLHRAHGVLVAFHHNTGHAMDHFAAAEELLGQTDNQELADRLREELLPQGVVPRADGPERWTYEVLEAFQTGLYDDARAFERDARSALTDGERHAAERRQQRRWRNRARDR